MIENARIVTNTGPALETGSLVFKGGRITELGPTVSAPLLSRKMDASGKFITPGFIDTYSALAHLGGSDEADPTARAADDIAIYAHASLEDVLRQGVTTAYVGTRGGPGVNGIGAIVKVVPGDHGAMARVVDDDAALCIDLNSNASAVTRLKTFAEVRKAFRTAVDYRIALEDYDDELKDYEEKLEKRRKEKEQKAAAKEGEAKGEKAEGAKGDEKKPTPDQGKPEKDKPKPPPEPKPGPKPNDGSQGSAVQLAENGDDDGGDEKKAEPEGKSDAEPEKGEKKKEGNKDELKKPEKPKPDRKSEVLLRAIDHELPVRITAHRSADILNAIELAMEFKFDLIVEGATEAYLVADALAKAKATVVLGPVSQTETFEDSAFRRHSVRNAAALSKAGVTWSIGSGAATARSARFVALNAQLAAEYGATKTGWLPLVTSRAADVLGLSRRAGRLAQGMGADFVIWSGDPSDPGSRVEQVYIGGKVAYDAHAGGGS